MAIKKVSADDYNTADIDRMFEKVPKGMQFVGTGWGLGKKKTVKKATSKAKTKKKSK